MRLERTEKGKPFLVSPFNFLLFEHDQTNSVATTVCLFILVFLLHMGPLCFKRVLLWSTH